MRRRFSDLTDGDFDVLVVGGGINGTGVARDAARRGLRVALVEKEDVGYGTTSRSTRLIHGGLRYLELMDFGLVRESLRERERLLRNAPHLVQPMEFLIPIYKGVTPGRLKLRAGLTLYDLLSYDKSLPNHRFMSAKRALEREPALSPEGLKGAATYHDAQVPHVERLCLENALDAARHGAVVVNHAEVIAVVRDDAGAVVGARVRDGLTGDEVSVRARVTVNATGPWLDDVLGLVGDDTRPRLRTTKGVHLVTPPVVNNAVVLFAKDGRLFFAIPWEQQSLIGTTDTDYTDDMDAVHATGEDVAYLRESFARFFPGADLDTVHYTTAGVRSLLNVEGVSESDVTRKHLILDHGHVEGVPGLVSIIGGKITPHRSVCEEVVDLVAEKLGRGGESDTVDAPLPGAFPGSLHAYVDAHAEATARARGVPPETVAHLIRLYGARHGEVLDKAKGHPGLLAPVCPHAPDVWAQVAFAAEEEMAETVADALLRRTTVGHGPCAGLDAAEAAAELMGERLGWSPGRRAREVAAYRDEVALRMRHDAPARGAAADGGGRSEA